MDTELIGYVKASFINNYKTKPILVFAPGRINIIGEHVDYNNGFVLSAAINKGIVTAIQKSTSKFCGIIALNKNETYKFSLDNIHPIPNGGWRNYILGVIVEIQKKGIKLDPFNIVFAGNIPGGAGMSSSAALENSVVYGLNKVFQLELTKKEMIYISQKSEHNFVGVKCGIMDQYTSMFGQKNKVLLLDCRTVQSIPFNIDFKDYEIVLINTNVKHNLSESAYNDRRSVCEKIASILGVKELRNATEKDLLEIKNQISEQDYQKVLYVVQEIIRVQQASKAIEHKNILALGKLLYASHLGLQKQYQVSCDELDFLVKSTKDKEEILGARMMGGGFGGCTINIIKKDSKKVLNQIISTYQSKFNIQPSVYHVKLNDGVKVLKMMN
ncbi:MAG: galactokinase [Polaribacter sp.]